MSRLALILSVLSLGLAAAPAALADDPIELTIPGNVCTVCHPTRVPPPMRPRFSAATVGYIGVPQA